MSVLLTRLLLDTVTFLFAIESSHRISRRAKSALENSTSVLELSAVSVAEIALKSALGKLALSRESVIAAVDDLQLKILPCTADHALRLFDLPLHHRDPFDRLMIAQALAENIPVVTCDPHFRLYKGLTIVWQPDSRRWRGPRGFRTGRKRI
jgi:PIN domain nuclease of toxin-antitoxin system